MEHIYAPSGTTHKINVLVEDIQAAASNNLSAIEDVVIDSYGIRMDSDTSMQVTTTSNPPDSPSFVVTIAPGVGVTTSHQYIKISTPQTYTFTASNAVAYNFYVKYKAVASGTITVTNGYYVNQLGSTVTYREIDGFEFVKTLTTDAAPADSLLLATVTTDSTGIILLVDKRSTNVLTAWSLAKSKYIQTAGTLPRPLNVRITDIDSSTRTTGIFPSAAYYGILNLDAAKGLMSNQASVSIKWNWDDLSGQGNSNAHNSFSVTLKAGQTWAVNALVNSHLYLTNYGLDYIITANGSAVNAGDVCSITVTPYKHTKDIYTAIGSGVTTNAVIHSNALYYEIVAVPVVNNIELPAHRIEAISGYGANVPSSNCILEIPIPYLVNIYVRGVNLEEKSAYTTMSAGSFSKPSDQGWANTSISYTSPALIKVPDILDTNVAVSLVGLNSSVQVSITGWDAATDFEIVYATTYAGVSFSDDMQQRFITKQREFTFQVPKGGIYWVGVRPLICGQVVALARLATVSVGYFGGSSPERLLATYPIDLITYSGSITTYDETIESYNTTSIKTLYNNKATYGNVFPSTVIGKILTITSTDTNYRIMNVSGSVIGLQDLVTGEAITSTALNGQAFTVGTSELGRMIGRAQLGSNLTITRAAIEISSAYTTNTVVNLRVYQDGDSGDAGNITLNTVQGLNNVSVDLNVVVSGDNLVVVDGYDPNGLYNSASLSGRITLFGKTSD